MRFLRERPVDELEGFQEFDVAVADSDLPEVGDHLRWRDRVYEILGVFRWYETYSEALDYQEVAVTLRLRPDDRRAGYGVRELAPGGPSSLSTGAEAVPPELPPELHR
jgi:hypothetical protein